MGTCLCVEDNSSSSRSATRNDRVSPTVALDDSHDDHDVRSSLPLPSLPSSPSGRRHPNEMRNGAAPQHPPLVQHHLGAEDGDHSTPCFAEHRTTTLMMRTQQQQQEQDDPPHLQQETVHRKGSSIAPTHERRPTLGGGSGACILNPLLPPSSAALPPPSLKRSSFAVPGPLDSSKLPHIPFTADAEDKVLEEGGKSHLLLDAQQQPIPLTNNVGLSTATADSNECSLNRNAAPPNPSFLGVVDSTRSEATTGEMMLMSPELRRCGRPSVGLVSTRGESSSGGGLSGGAGAALLPTSTTAQQQPHLFPQLSQRPSTPSNEASELRNGLLPTTARRLASEPLSDTNTPLRPQPQPLPSSSTPTAAASPHHSNTRGAEEATAAAVALVGVGSPHRYEARGGGGTQPPTTPLKTSRKPHVTVTPTHSKSKPSTGGGGGIEHHHRNPPRPQQPPPQSALQDFQTTVAGSPTHPYNYSPRYQQQIRSSHTIPIQTLVAQMHHPGSTARIKWLFLDTESCEEEVRREWAVHRQIQGTVWYLKPAAAAALPAAAVVAAARKPSSHSGSGCLELSTSAAAMVAADGGSGPFRNASQDNSPIVDQRTSIC